MNEIVKNFFSNIESLYGITEEQKVCWIMEKENICEAPQKGYQSKDGIHFLFPYIVAEKSTYRKLRELILETDYNSIFEKEDKIPPSNSMDEIVDDSIYKGGNWFCYGQQVNLKKI